MIDQEYDDKNEDFIQLKTKQIHQLLESFQIGNKEQQKLRNSLFDQITCLDLVTKLSIDNDAAPNEVCSFMRHFNSKCTSLSKSCQFDISTLANNPYISFQQVSDVRIINDIIENDAVLRHLHKICSWLQDIQEEETVQLPQHSFVANLEQIDPDFFQNQLEGHQKAQVSRIYKLAFKKIRKGNIQAAQSIFQQNNLEWMASNLNLGLPYQEIQDTSTNPYVLDFMNTEELTKCVPRGNKNWLLSVKQFYRNSMIDPVNYEQGINGYLGLNLNPLLNLAESFHDKMWSFIRTYLNQEVIKKFLMFHSVFQNIDKLTNLNENIFQSDIFEIQNELGGLQNNHIEKLFQTIENIDNQDYIQQIQFMLIKTQIKFLQSQNQDEWEPFFEKLNELSYQTFIDEATILKQSFLELFANLTIAIRLQGLISAPCYEIADKIIMRYVEFIGKQQLESKVFEYFQYIQNEELVINGFSDYLLPINDQNQIFQLQKAIQTKFPNLADKILKQVFDKRRNIDAADEEKIDALKWILKEPDNDIAINNTCILMRQFLKQQKSKQASEVFNQAQQIIKKFMEQGMLNQNFYKIDNEIQTYTLLFNIFEDYNSHFSFQFRQRKMISQNNYTVIKFLNQIRKCLFGYNQINFYHFLMFDVHTQNQVDIQCLEQIKQIYVSKLVSMYLEVDAQYPNTLDIHSFIALFQNPQFQIQNYFDLNTYQITVQSFSLSLMKNNQFIDQLILNS